MHCVAETNEFYWINVANIWRNRVDLFIICYKTTHWVKGSLYSEGGGLIFETAYWSSNVGAKKESSLSNWSEIYKLLP